MKLFENEREKMIRCLCVLVVALGVFVGVNETVNAQGGNTLTADIIRDRIKVAKEICERQSPSFTTEVVVTEQKKTFRKKGKDGKVRKILRTIKKRSESVVERPIVFCAFNERDQSWHVIEIHVPYPQKEEFQFTLKTPGYRLERVSGRGVARLIFNAYLVTDHGEEKLIVYRYLHAWFSDGSLAKGNSAKHLLEDARFVSYTPLSPDLFNNELLVLGMRYLYDELGEAYRELREAGEPSKAFPQELLADMIDWRIPFALAANEQMDHDKFNQDEWGTTADVYTEFALNGHETFMWSFSNFPHKGRTEHAVGVMQFTNHMGTYDSVRKNCPRARLDPDFLRGTQNLRNSLKAAICLLDIELARLPGVHALYRSNPAIGGVYPVIAYNAGGGRARSAYNAIVASGIDLEKADIGLPEQIFVRRQRCSTCVKKRGQGSALKVLPDQTEMYVKKYIYVLKFIEQFHPERPSTTSLPEEDTSGQTK